MAVLWWTRRDLRLHDNPALAVAVERARGGGVVAAFVCDPAIWRGAGARRELWRSAVSALQVELPVVVRVGDPAVELLRLCRELDIAELVATREHSPFGVRRDRQVEMALRSARIEVRWEGSNYAVEPGALASGVGQGYQVFSAYFRAWTRVVGDIALRTTVGCEALRPPNGGSWAPSDPWPTHTSSVGPASTNPIELAESPTEATGLARLDRFVDSALATYGHDRDRPAHDATSHLSQHLRVGQLSPRTAVARAGGVSGVGFGWVRQLAWRDFLADVLWRRPELLHEGALGWERWMDYDTGPDADRAFAAWCAGETGEPLVDAGMRQLWATGWMPNRVRMVAASYLVKDLHLDWRRGARWFMEHLLDADPASNQLNWQWVAGCGLDAAPYFRVFNPVMQARKFDPAGAYVREWLPELGTAFYGSPLVDHASERVVALARHQVALERWRHAKARGSPGA